LFVTQEFNADADVQANFAVDLPGMELQCQRWWLGGASGTQVGGSTLALKYGTAIVENLTCEPLEWQYMTPDFLLSTVGEVQGQSNFVC
jgi:hypothetical protein